MLTFDYNTSTNSRETRWHGQWVSHPQSGFNDGTAIVLIFTVGTDSGEKSTIRVVSGSADETRDYLHTPEMASGAVLGIIRVCPGIPKQFYVDFSFIQL